MGEAIVTFDVSDVVSELQQRFGDRIKNLPMDAFATLLVGAVDEMFETEGEAGTEGAWEPFALSTIDRNPKRAGGMLLQDSGALANIQVFEVDDFSMTVGSRAEYAEFHTEGTVNMPQRDFFALKFDAVLDEMADILLQDMQ